MAKRSELVSAEIQKILGHLFLSEYSGNIISVFDVITSKDLLKSSVWIKIIGNAHLFKKIYRDKDHHRYLLARKLSLRRVPDLEYYLVKDNPLVKS